MNRAISALAPAFIGTVMACSGPAPVSPTGVVRSPQVSSGPVAEAAPVPARPGLDVRYRDEWFGAVQLLGIDSARHRALVRLEGNADGRLAIDTIDLEDGVRVGRWEATAENARATLGGYPQFRPLSGSFEEDISKFASLVHDTGPWYMRGRPSAPTVLVSENSEYILYGAPPDDGTDGDWLYVVDRQGQRPRRIDPGLRASYSPVLSPDGQRVAWRGCQTSPCDYGLFVTRLGGTPERMAKVSAAGAPVWSADGTRLYAMGSKGTDSCLYEVAPERRWDARALMCVSGLSDVAFVQDPEGRTGVVTGSRGEPGSQVAEISWVLLENGEVLAHHEVPGASGRGLVNNAGMFAMSVQKGGVALVDLITGNHAGIGGSDEWFYGLSMTKWDGDRIFVVRKPGGESREFHIVSVDARELIAQADKWRDGVDGI